MALAFYMTLERIQGKLTKFVHSICLNRNWKKTISPQWSHSLDVLKLLIATVSTPFLAYRLVKPAQQQRRALILEPRCDKKCTGVFTLLRMAMCGACLKKKTEQKKCMPRLV